MLGKFFNRNNVNDRKLTLTDRNTNEKITILYSTAQAKQEALDYLNSDRSYLDDLDDEDINNLV